MSLDKSIDCKTITLLQQTLGKLCMDWFFTFQEKSDVVYSTHSMFLAFSLLYLGAEGETKNELSKVFGYSSIGEEEIFTVLSFLMSHKYSKNSVEIVDAIWASQHFEFFKEYIEKIEKLSCRISTADFEKDVEKTQKEINNYVAEKTRNLIQQLIPSGFINSSTAAILINTIYFKGTWSEKFDVLPNKMKFGNSQEVTMLSNKVCSAAVFSNEYTACCLSYSDTNNQIAFVMPNDIEKFEKAREGEIYEIMRSLSQNFPEKRSVTFPKFSVESSVNMVQQLRKLGLNLPFSCDANFSKMAKGKILCV
ncbi:serine protease inhibitor, serpin, putative [Entamoeba invadens IP1]|uniref:Serine protease inhibitor, serpin, putative n=1 Tax=Entamoeba invadens IP1 TaxID=370355 RepID=L7FLK0_ENTIV|nr:serine protease inhibitor, serpin, putative [Entamoeba invadens IP1]ELP84034.1 serine protease inhibitor, serpin, putative [Entamoeba invadens IP1]|eukprot:XP_004183380.1 serine protease inhibitor, serpin, putative [Entamoeba invadens IP1]